MSNSTNNILMFLFIVLITVITIFIIYKAVTNNSNVEVLSEQQFCAQHPNIIDSFNNNCTKVNLYFPPLINNN